MIFLDVTKTAAARHASGLMRVNRRLHAALAGSVRAVRWSEWDRRLPAGDWFLTAEVFAPEERPGLEKLLAESPGRCAAIFHDAIPLKHPHITWPQSVARHAAYLKQLAGFHQVWAVSRASRDELLGFWRWQRVTPRAAVDVLTLGADFDGTPRVTRRVAPIEPRFLCVGILEPRKNQTVLLDAASRLWDAGHRFHLDLVGRVNPHFGRPLRERVRRMQREYPGLHYHGAVDDAGLAERWATARATLFPTLAEGCGLPLLESLWRAVPCVCSDLPVLRETATAGGCVLVPSGDSAAWADVLQRLLTEPAWADALAADASTRALPTWAETAQQVRAGLGG